METKNYKDLFVGTLVAAATLMLTGFLYYNVIKDTPVVASSWGYKVLYTLVVAFALSYLCWKTKRVRKSHILTGVLIGLVVSILILAVSRLIFFNSNETIICCQGDDCWILVFQIMFATAMASATGKTGSGGDD